MAETLVLGHRGAPRVAPENTAAAFRAALQAGADGVELDVRQTLDGHLVCYHDAALGRTARGDGLIQDLPLAALRELDAGDWHHPRFAGTRIPTLDEALAALAPARLVEIEAKSPEGDRDLLLPSISDSLGAFLQARRDGPPVLVAAMQVHVLREIHEIAPAVPLAAIVARSLAPPEWRFVLGLPLAVVSLGDEWATPARIADAHAAGRAVHVWTVNDPDRARRLRDLGVAALISDDPASVAAAVRA